MPSTASVLASKRSGTLHLGVARDLGRRVWEHEQKVCPGFTSRYDVRRLVWYERYERVDEALAREKALTKWRRAWTIASIED